MKHWKQQLMTVHVGWILVLASATAGFGQEAQWDRVTFDFYPLYAVYDDRTSAPKRDPDTDPMRVFHLYDHLDLAHFRVALANVGGREIGLDLAAGDGWFESLDVTVRRDGKIVPTAAPRVLARTSVTTEWLRDGEPLSEMAFAAKGIRYLPALSYDSHREVRREVSGFAETLAPYASLEVTFELLASDGSPLPDGSYDVEVAYDVSALNLRLTPNHPRILRPAPLGLVLGEPKTDFERVQSTIVRAGYLRKQGQMDEAIAELELACEQIPSSLKAHGALAAYYYDAGRMQESLDQLEKLRRLAEDPALRSAQKSLNQDLDPHHLQASIDHLKRRLASSATP
ncbi:MAG: tetratricopeptide repeat protein [Acidobacteriota bacterium]